jgi:hypothetical protein
MLPRQQQQRQQPLPPSEQQQPVVVHSQQALQPQQVLPVVYVAPAQGLPWGHMQHQPQAPVTNVVYVTGPPPPSGTPQQPVRPGYAPVVPSWRANPHGQTNGYQYP